MLLKMPNNNTIHPYQNSIQVNRKLKEKRNHKLREREGEGVMVMMMRSMTTALMITHFSDGVAANDGFEITSFTVKLFETKVWFSLSIMASSVLVSLAEYLRIGKNI